MQRIIEVSNCVDIRMRQCLAKVLFCDKQERLDLLLGTECIKRNRIGNRSLSGTLLPELPESELELNPVDSLMHSRKNQLYLHKCSLLHREEIQRQ